MNHNFTLAILVEKGVITLKEAEHLSTKLAGSIHSQVFSDAYRFIQGIFKDIEKKNKFL